MSDAEDIRDLIERWVDAVARGDRAGILDHHGDDAAEREIKALVTDWANAVHRRNLVDVLTDHADDIVMFDVPPPDDGVQVLVAYRETRPPFSSGRRAEPHSKSSSST